MTIITELLNIGGAGTTNWPLLASILKIASCSAIMASLISSLCGARLSSGSRFMAVLAVTSAHEPHSDPEKLTVVCVVETGRPKWQEKLSL
jgi:hypothetical protein